MTPTRWPRRQLAGGAGWMARPPGAVTALWALILLGPGTRGQGREGLILVALLIVGHAVGVMESDSALQWCSTANREANQAKISLNI